MNPRAPFAEVFFAIAVDTISTDTDCLFAEGLSAFGWTRHDWNTYAASHAEYEEALALCREHCHAQEVMDS